MLMPKRVKFRRVQRGRLKGKALRGNKITNGAFGLVALEPAWITSNQIEAARIAMTRYIKRGGKVWIYKGEVLNEVNRPAQNGERRDRRGDRKPSGDRRGDRRNGDRRDNRAPRGDRAPRADRAPRDGGAK